MKEIENQNIEALLVIYQITIFKVQSNPVKTRRKIRIVFKFVFKESRSGWIL